MCVGNHFYMICSACLTVLHRQGSVLSLFCLLCIWMVLLVELSKSGVGCHWGSSFAGGFSYADDVVLLAPRASALRTMLNIFSSFAACHKLEFNSWKTQLMCFHLPSVHPITVDLNNIKMSFIKLCFVSCKKNGHILSST